MFAVYWWPPVGACLSPEACGGGESDVSVVRPPGAAGESE